jgi:hypothetical protein
MTTQEYQEAYDDDADQVRSWPAQDAQEPHCGHVETPCGCDNSPDPYQAYDAMRAQRDAAHIEIAYLNSEATVLLAAWDETLADLDAARRTIARMNADDRADCWCHDCQCHGLLP